ncbi:MAG TPA: hypothetical protein VH325_07850 [Bryobacteraceae bacterium]|nr:hypothetical protein [Bryobacteraceae bacterium]
MASALRVLTLAGAEGGVTDTVDLAFVMAILGMDQDSNVYSLARR